MWSKFTTYGVLVPGTLSFSRGGGRSVFLIGIAGALAALLAVAVFAFRSQARALTDLASSMEQLNGSIEIRETRIGARIEQLSDLLQQNVLSDNLINRRLELRVIMIQSQMAQARDPVIVMGDSITEAALLPASICGYEIINAGVGGMTIKSYLPVARSLLHEQRVAAVVLALGVNDATKASQRAPVDRAYASLLDVVRSDNRKIIMAGVAPLDMTGAMAKSYFDPELAKSIDDDIHRFADAYHLPFIDLRRDIDAVGRTVDGVHLAPSGYQQWTAAILNGIRSAVCTQTSAN